MKIFIDFDGVLKGLWFDPKLSIFEQLDEILVANFKAVVDYYDADIVISSGHKCDYDIDEFNKYFWGRVIDKTPSLLGTRSNRSNEVLEWLNENSVDEYLLLDDNADLFGYYLYEFPHKAHSFHNWFFTNAHEGLTESVANRMIDYRGPFLNREYLNQLANNDFEREFLAFDDEFRLIDQCWICNRPSEAITRLPFGVAGYRCKKHKFLFNLVKGGVIDLYINKEN